MKLWGGRFETGPSEIFERFSNSLHFDRRLLAADVRGSQAFARSLTRAGVLTVPECGQIITKPSIPIREDATSPSFFEGAADEDVHFSVRHRQTGSSGLANSPIRFTPAAAATSRYRSTRGSGCATNATMRLGIATAILRGRLSGGLLRRRSIPTPSSPAIHICGEPSRCYGRITLLAYFRKCLRARS